MDVSRECVQGLNERKRREIGREMEGGCTRRKKGGKLKLSLRLVLRRFLVRLKEVS